MAQFKEMTLVDGNKITINLDEVRAMQRFSDFTSIWFDKEQSFSVKETPSKILEEQQDSRL
jgi:hypothetical protein